MTRETNDELIALLPTLGDASAVWMRNGLKHPGPSHLAWPVAITLLRLEREKEARDVWLEAATSSLSRVAAERNALKAGIQEMRLVANAPGDDIRALCDELLHPEGAA